MSMRTRDGLLGGLGRACYRHRKTTLLAWIAGVAVLITLWMRFGAAADNSFSNSDPGQTLLNEHFARQSGDTLTLAIRSAAPVTSPAVRARVESALVPFASAPHVTGVTNPYTTPGHVSRDGHIAYATVQFSVSGNEHLVRRGEHADDDATKASGNGVTFSLGGDAVDLAETPYGGPSNGIGVAAAMVVLLIAFGSLLAMGLPVATALFGIGAGLSLIALLGHIFPAPSFSPIIAALIGLGVGVDYALFIFTRFRTELRDGEPARGSYGYRDADRGGVGAHRGLHRRDRHARAARAAPALLNGVAVAAAATVAMTVLGALTLLPALLALFSGQSTGTRLGKPTACWSAGGTASAVTGRQSPPPVLKNGLCSSRTTRSQPL